MTSERILLFLILSMIIVICLFLRSSESYEAREGVSASILTRMKNEDGSDYDSLESHFHAQLQPDDTWEISDVDDGVLTAGEISFLNTVYDKSDRVKIKEYISGEKTYPSLDIIKNLITTPLDEVKALYIRTRNEVRNYPEQLAASEANHRTYVSTVRDTIDELDVEAMSLQGELEALKSERQSQRAQGGNSFITHMADELKPPPPPPPPPPEVKEFSTPMYPPKGGRKGYRVGELTAFDVDCENGELTGFEFNLDGFSGKYDYTCNNNESSPGVAKNTDFKYAGGSTGNITALSNHTVDCENKAISQFKLNTAPGSGWWEPKDFKYDYKCSSRETSGRCREDIMTPGYSWSHTGRWNGVSGVHPKCNDNEVLTKFKYVYDGQGNNMYQYTCCEVTN